MVFDQELFDAICSNVDAVPLSRAAAASSAVPVALSPVTLNNYGGTCNYVPPVGLQLAAKNTNPSRSAERAKRQVDEWLALTDGAHRPYIHLVDGGLADNVGMRSFLMAMDLDGSAACGRRGNLARQRAPDRRCRRQLGNHATNPLGPLGESAGRRQPRAAVVRRADGTLFVRSHGTVERQVSKLAVEAPAATIGGLRGQHGSGHCRRAEGSRYRYLSHRRFVRGGEG
ncbi:MAG: hypothetical protein U1F59_02415 [Candidatus Competibacteraceae bacterium]